MAYGRIRRRFGWLVLSLAGAVVAAIVATGFFPFEIVSPGQSFTRVRVCPGHLCIERHSNAFDNAGSPFRGSAARGWSIDRGVGGPFLFWLPPGEIGVQAPDLSEEMIWHHGFASRKRVQEFLTSRDEYRLVLWPVPVLVALFGVVPILLSRWASRRSKRCVRCGYDLTGLMARSPCPECGSPK